MSAPYAPILNEYARADASAYEAFGQVSAVRITQKFLVSYIIFPIECLFRSGRDDYLMTLQTTDPMPSVIEIRDMMNDGRITELNALVSDDFFAVFSLGKSGEYETYNATVYRQGNIDANEYYSGQNPRWDYTDFSSGMRDDTEFVISSAIDFRLNGELIKKALVTEVYRFEDNHWKLARQYMEKYKP